MAKTQTTIWDKNGNAQQGYISEGKTYYNDGNRISDGSRVIDSSGREWTMQGGKGVLTGNVNTGKPQNATGGSQPNAGNNYDNLLSAYEKRQADIMQQQQEAARLAMEKSVGNLESQKTSVNSGFDDAARQAYILKMQNQKALPEQLAAQGQNGGATETATLKIGTDYENNVSDINKQRTTTLSGIDAAINDVRTTGNIENANLAALNAQSNLETYMQLMQNKISAEETAASNAKNDYISTIGAYYDDYQKEINRIKTNIELGDASESWKIPYLQAARQQKISDIQQAEAKNKQQEFENNNTLENTAIRRANAARKSTSSKPKMTLNEAFYSEQAAASSGALTPSDLEANKVAYIRMYGADKYYDLVEIAKLAKQ